MFGSVRDEIKSTLDGIRQDGLYKDERVITTPQRANIGVGGDEVLNLCANNYLGLADHPEVIAAAREALDTWGFGTASVRFICGTQSVHKELERRLTEFLGTEDTVLYGSCFDANGGLFETLLGPDDVVISDELNHASIIDGIRLSKANRRRYRNADPSSLAQQLADTTGAGRRLIATDGVFSMDGYYAPLDRICELAEEHGAMVMVDDSHAAGFVGENGRGTHERYGVLDRVDIITGTLGKVFGGASGGYVSGRAEIVELLRQRSRPYLFSNSLAPSIAGASLRVLDLLAESGEHRQRLRDNTRHFRERLAELGFEVLPGEHPIIPVMLGDAVHASHMAELLLDKGIYVTAFSYPVVPHGQARIRTQMSAAHTPDDLERAARAFAEAAAELD